MILATLLLSIPQPLISAGKLVDAIDKQPIAGAMVFSSIDTAYTSLDGSFSLKTDGNGFSVKFVSYQQGNFKEGGIVELQGLKPQNISYRAKK
jgi:hypothetical protein